MRTFGAPVTSFLYGGVIRNSTCYRRRCSAPVQTTLHVRLGRGNRTVPGPEWRRVLVLAPVTPPHSPPRRRQPAPTPPAPTHAPQSERRLRTAASRSRALEHLLMSRCHPRSCASAPDAKSRTLPKLAKLRTRPDADGDSHAVYPPHDNVSLREAIHLLGHAGSNIMTRRYRATGPLGIGTCPA